VRPLRRAIAGEVHKLVASRASEGFDPAAVREDEGYFGPGSVAWRVHGDFTTMLVGGVGALLLQMLHPGALAGVWDHSDFRKDMSGRLRRTAQFLAGTTYGSRAQADALIARVKAIHDQVSGTLPDGRAYSANDPDLLTWVHIAGSRCFLRSWLLYGGALTQAERDLYFEETKVIAEKLGARHVPASEAEAEAYLEAMRPQLRADARTQAVATALLNQPAPAPLLEPFRRLVMAGGADLLPDWAARLHGLRPSAALRPGLGFGLRSVRSITSWALKPEARR
jgi:uncharacterized protein (DUF2236 family)